MTRTLPVVTALLVAVTLAVIPATAHINHVTADPQISANGTVVVETAYVGSDAWVVIHRDEGGTPGEAIGHTRIRAGGLKTDVTVPVNRAAWTNWSNQTVWVTLHRDQGDSSFDPAEDPTYRSFDRPAGEQITLARGNPAVVTAAGFSPKRSAGDVTVRRATLPTDGHVVLHNGSVDGRVVGHVSQTVGTHRNVTVALNESFYRRHDRAILVATLYTDDGDGTFDQSDTLVRAGDVPVAAEFAVYLRNHSVTRTESLVTTATPGETGSTTSSAKPGEHSPTGGNGPGFGLAGTVTALIFASLVGVLRRYDRA